MEETIYANQDLKITIVGLEENGLLNALNLAERHDVIGLDFFQDKVDSLNNGQFYSDYPNYKQYAILSKLRFKATTDTELAFKNADYIFMCLSTENIDNIENPETELTEKMITHIRSLN